MLLIPIIRFLSAIYFAFSLCLVAIMNISDSLTATTEDFADVRMSIIDWAWWNCTGVCACVCVKLWRFFSFFHYPTTVIVTNVIARTYF